MRENGAEERRTHPWEQSPEGAGVSFGSWLRQQREIRGISLREIANVSKISIRYLEALEASRFGVLPAPVFAKGFLRQYASYVGLDPDEVVNFYIVAQQEIEPEDADENAGSQLHSSTHWAYGLFLTVGIVLLFGLVALLSFFAERKTPRDEPPPPMAAPVFTPPPPVVPVAAAPADQPLVVTLDFIQDSWVEASVDGENRVSELRVQGESLRLEAAERVALTLGNALGVRVQVNGEDHALPPGTVVNDHEISLEPLVTGDGPVGESQ